MCGFRASFRYCVYRRTHPVDRPLALAIDHGHAYFLTSPTISSTDTACTCVQNVTDLRCTGRLYSRSYLTCGRATTRTGTGITKARPDRAIFPQLDLVRYNHRIF